MNIWTPDNPNVPETTELPENTPATSATQKRTRIVLVGAGLAAAATLGVGGVALANAQSNPANSASSVPVLTTDNGSTSKGATANNGAANNGAANNGAVPNGGAANNGAAGAAPGPGGGPMDAGGTLTAEAASKVVSAALAKVSGGTVSSVRALADGTYEAHVTQSDGAMVEVLLDKSFAATAVQERGPGGPGGPGGGPGGQGGAGGTLGNGSAPSDGASSANGTA